MKRVYFIAVLLAAVVGLTVPFVIYDYNTVAIFVLSGLLIAVLPLLFQVKSKFDIFEPKWLVLFLYMMYIVISPIYHIMTENTSFLGTNFSVTEYERASLMSAIGVLFLWLGYYSTLPDVYAKKIKPIAINENNIISINKLLGITTLLSFVALIVLTGSSINRFLLPGILTPELQSYTSLSSNPYLFNIAFESWVAILLVWIAFKPGKNKFLKFIVIAFVAIIYASYGARYRLLMLGSIFILTYLLKNKRPRLINVGILFTLVSILFTWIGTYRWSARSGLVIEVTSFFDSLFKHQRLLEPFAKIMQYVPDVAPYEYGKSLLYTLILPIPRAIWPNKPDPNFRSVLEESVGSLEAYGSGLAYPNFGEYYQNFGIVGMLVCMFILGALIRAVYVWYTVNSTNRWTIILYAMFLPFLYQVISRGYLGQIVQEGVFIFAPAILMILLSNHVFIKKFVLSSNSK